MAKLIWVPQLPVKMRYTEWIIDAIPRELMAMGKFDSVVTIKGAGSVLKTAKNGSFSLVEESLIWEADQIASMAYNRDVCRDSILLLGDFSFPGLVRQVLYHLPFKRKYCICHGSAKNTLDYYEKFNPFKSDAETADSQLFDKIFVGTEYHKRKLGWDNVVVTGLPLPQLLLHPSSAPLVDRPINIISVARQSEQKVSKEIEEFVSDRFGTIYRANYSTWSDYYRALRLSKILLISSKEETFGYQVVDAVLSGCIPVAPNKFSYPELISNRYLYDDLDQLERIIDRILNIGDRVPVLLNIDLMKDFYSTITKHMLED